MKPSGLFAIACLLQIISLSQIECQDFFPPDRNVEILINETFTLTLQYLTNADTNYAWKYKSETGFLLIEESIYSEDFTIVYEEGPDVGDKTWKNTSLTGSFKTDGEILIICFRNAYPFFTKVVVSATATTAIFSDVTTSPTIEPVVNTRKMPPKPSGFLLSSPKQGEVKLDWRVYPKFGPHCLTYFNISYKNWLIQDELSSLEWIHLEQKAINIIDETATTYSYKLSGLALQSLVKFQIVSYCSINGAFKDKVSDAKLVEEHFSAQIYGLPESRNVTAGETIRLNCNANGFPTPSIEWTKSLTSNDLQSDSYTKDDNFLIFQSISVDDAGTYYCTATNSPNGTFTSDKRGITLYVSPSVPVVPVAYCAMAVINDCSPFLSEMPGHYVMSSELEDKARALKNYLLSVTSTRETDPCYRAGMKYLCNNLFRPCDPIDSPIQVVSPYDDYCKKDCIDFWYSSCTDAYVKFTVSDLYRSFNWLRECENITSDPNSCVPLGIKDIMSTVPIPATNDQSTEDPTTTEPPSIMSLVAGIVVIFFVIVIVIIGIIVLCVMYYRQISKPQLCSSKFTESKVAENQFYLPFNSKTPMTDKKEFPRAAVRFLRKLGQGQFGSVDLAEASTIVPGEKTTLVAVKILHEGATTKNRLDFEREADIMLRFDHPNILQLLGVSFKDKTAPLCLIFEYMEKGDLNNYLRGCASSYIKRFKGSRPTRSRTESEISEDPPVLSTNDLVNISNQIAGGMHYLSVRSFVHRDLATRNCLVGKNLVVKIGDFGMSKDVYKSDYYRIGKEALLPIKWMAPEAIMYGKATIQTDIWSFGVLMWEVFSFAMQPWYGFTNEQVIEKVKGGEILSKPDNCPQLIYSLMLECWDMDASKRINFESILQRLCSWRVSSTESTSLPDVAQDTCDPFDDEITQVTTI